MDEIVRLQNRVAVLEEANGRLHERLASEGESRDAEIARLTAELRDTTWHDHARTDRDCKKETAVWRKDMKYPMCRSSHVEDPFI